MFKTFLHRMQSVFAHPHPSAVDETKHRHFPTLTLAAKLLTAPSALMELSLAEARVVVRYMQPKQIPVGAVFIRAGDEQNTDFMVLILSGDVTVESIEVNRIAPITLTVLGPGSMHGELGLLDGLPRSATCTACTDLRCMILTREAMLKLLKDDPRIGAKLMMAIAIRIGERLRDNTDKLRKFVQLTKAMQQELESLTPE